MHRTLLGMGLFVETVVESPPQMLLPWPLHHRVERRPGVIVGLIGISEWLSATVVELSSESTGDEHDVPWMCSVFDQKCVTPSTRDSGVYKLRWPIRKPSSTETCSLRSTCVGCLTVTIVLPCAYGAQRGSGLSHSPVVRALKA